MLEAWAYRPHYMSLLTMWVLIGIDVGQGWGEASHSSWVFEDLATTVQLVQGMTSGCTSHLAHNENSLDTPWDPMGSTQALGHKTRISRLTMVCGSGSGNRQWLRRRDLHLRSLHVGRVLFRILWRRHRSHPLRHTG